jgi:alpha-mannosidase
VDVSGPGGGVTWSPVESTIATLGDLRLFHWDAAYKPQNARVYANVLNNGWSTNFQEWQGGDFRFRFRFRGHRGGWDQGRAPAFGRETAQPLLATVVEGKGPAAAGFRPRASYLRADSEEVVLVNLKRAEDGGGFVLRFFNPLARPGAVRVSVPSRPLRGAERVQANEAALAAGALEVKDGGFALELGAFALETVRVRF